MLKINQIRFDRRMLFSVLRIGIPAGLESVMYNISNIVIQVFVNNLGTDTVAAWGNSWENRCYFLDGDQCVRNFHYYLCGTEFRSRQISSYAKECECLHGHEYGQFCGDDHFDVFICSLDLSSVYHRQRSDRPWCSYESFFTAVLFHLCNHRNFVRGTEGYRKGSGAYAPYLWWCVFFENPVAFYSRTDVSGNQYDHAQLSGFMEYYGGAVCCILFHEIPRKGKGRALPETETVTPFFMKKCSLSYVC